MKLSTYRFGCAVGLRTRMTRKQLLEIVAMRFVATGAWPKAEDVRRRLSASALSVDILAMLPARLGHIDNDDRVVLTLRALCKTGAAAGVVRDFMEAARFAAARYRDLDSGLTLSSEDLMVELSLSPLRAQRALALLKSEGLLRPSTVECASVEVTAEIDRFASVRGSRGYVRARAQGSRRSAPWLARFRSWLRGREHTTRDLIVIAFLGGLFVVIAAAVPNAIDRGPPPAKPQAPSNLVKHQNPLKPSGHLNKGHQQRRPHSEGPNRSADRTSPPRPSPPDSSTTTKNASDPGR